jgi:hypothetical protein
LVQAGVIADQKISMVKNIEGFRAELECDPVGQLKHPKERHVGYPVSGAHKGISAKIAYAAQARRGEKALWQIESIGPLGMRGVNIVGNGIGPVIGFSIKVVVATTVYAIWGIERGLSARTGKTGARL